MAKTKAEALADAVKDLNHRFGEGAVVKLSQSANLHIERMSSGSLSLDIALGGGYPRGRVIEIYGPESSGKTTLCLQAVAEAQAAGGVCAYIDMEHALDPEYAKKLGVNIDEMFVSQPDNGEQALEICETLVRSGTMAVVVVDSVAALVPLKELEGEMGDAAMGAQARLMSQALRKLAAAVDNTKTTVIFTNQLRQKIGVMFGNPEVTTGGNALKFYASQRLDVRRIQQLKQGDNIIGSRTRVKVVKNKVAPPFKSAEFDIVYNEGISKIGEIIDLGVSTGVIVKRGAFFSYGETRIGQGRQNAAETLKNDRPLAFKIEGEIRIYMNEHAGKLGGSDVVEETPADGA